MRSSLSLFTKAFLLLWAPLAVSAKQCSYGDDPSIIAHTGTAQGTELVYNNATLYVSTPECKKYSIGVIYLTDAFGIQFLQNKL